MKHLITSLSVLSILSLSPSALAEFTHNGLPPFATEHHSFEAHHPLFTHHYERPEGWHHDYNSAYYNHGYIHHSYYSRPYYGFHPLRPGFTYQSAPGISWFYINTSAPSTYSDSSSTATHYEAYPNSEQTLSFNDVYFPTGSMRELVSTVNGMDSNRKANFQSSIGTFTERLTQNLADVTGQHVVLKQGDVQLEHYEILSAGLNIEVSGTVQFQNARYEFKGMVALNQNTADARILTVVNNSIVNEPFAEPVPEPAITYDSNYQAPQVSGSKPWYPDDSKKSVSKSL